jgi:hypothetical protein
VRKQIIVGLVLVRPIVVATLAQGVQQDRTGALSLAGTLEESR